MLSVAWVLCKIGPEWLMCCGTVVVLGWVKIYKVVDINVASWRTYGAPVGANNHCVAGTGQILWRFKWTTMIWWWFYKWLLAPQGFQVGSSPQWAPHPIPYTSTKQSEFFLKGVIYRLIFLRGGGGLWKLEEEEKIMALLKALKCILVLPPSVMVFVLSSELKLGKLCSAPAVPGDLFHLCQEGGGLL